MIHHDTGRADDGLGSAPAGAAHHSSTLTDRTVSVQQTMNESGVKFGTSGARGLVTDLTDEVAYIYTRAFLQHLFDSGQIERGLVTTVAIGGDLRPSTQRIMEGAAQAVQDVGLVPTSVGNIPSPAVAAYGMSRGIPTVMVTGSHIPDDRNGIKFTTPGGEITKADEAGIRSQSVTIPSGIFLEGNLAVSLEDFSPDATAAQEYVERYRDVFPEQFLAGKKVGLYEHSAVGRDLYAEILRMYGAEVVSLGRSESFVPVDTEAIRPEDVAAAHQWAQEDELFAILSTDGDSDRPLVADESGAWFRGDIVGLLTAAALKADVVATPVSSNSAIEKSGLFSEVRRTRIGSPYVIESMQEEGTPGVVCGFEANGGFLLQTSARFGRGKELSALPTRDAVLPGLAIMAMAVAQNKKVSDLGANLPPRFTASDRLQEFPTDISQRIVREFVAQVGQGDYTGLEEEFGQTFGRVQSVDTTDGVRITFGGEDEIIVHLRPSGNAPEFRCYTEAPSEAKARDALTAALDVMKKWRDS